MGPVRRPGHRAAIPDCGHFIPEERPRLLLEYLYDFLAKP
jgi:pimeloyl-ACP methyl ester carboxylesterase